MLMFIGIIRNLSHPFSYQKHSSEIAGFWGNALFDSKWAIQTSVASSCAAAEYLWDMLLCWVKMISYREFAFHA